jgi:hypothetical protein
VVQRDEAMSSAKLTSGDLDALSEKWRAKYEKQKQAGWVHSMCLKCFRKRWPHGKYSSWQAPASLRQWEVCCFCLQKHKDGLHKTRDPLNRELRCNGIHTLEPSRKG